MRHVCLPSLLLGLTLIGSAAGQTIPAAGSEVFRFALHQKDVKPLATVREAQADPAGTIIIAIGTTDALNDYISGVQLRSFLMQGGAILIATDQSNAHNDFRGWTWGSLFRIEISGQPLRTAPALGYRNDPNRPLIPIAWPRGAEQPIPDGIREFTQIAADRPSEMSFESRLDGLSTEAWAKYPPGTVRARDGRRLNDQWNNFAVAIRPRPAPGRPTWGRMLVIADQSVFTNGMLGFVKDETRAKGYTLDNGNWEFTNTTIEWLRGGPAGGFPRTKCLFIENGRIIDKFAVELPPGNQPKMPNIPPELIANWLLNNADSIVNEYQDRGVFDKFLERRPELLRAVIRFIVIGLTVLFALIALRRFLRGYRKPDARPLPPAVVAGMLPRGGVARQRTDAQLDIGNLYEAASRRVRDRFDRLGGAPGPDGQMPPVLVANDIRDAELLHSAVAWLWPIGYGDVPVPVPPSEWDRVNALLERLTRRAAAGDWSFGGAVS